MADDLIDEDDELFNLEFIKALAEKYGEDCQKALQNWYSIKEKRKLMPIDVWLSFVPEVNTYDAVFLTKDERRELEYMIKQGMI